MKKSKLSLGLAFIVSLLALASCGENGKGDSDELWICAYDGGYGSTWIENAASDFEEKTGTKVHFDLDTSILDRIESALKDGGDYDIYFSHDIKWQNYAAEGLLASLDDVYSSTIEGTGKTFADRTVRGANENSKAMGADEQEHYFKACWTQGAGGFVYNMDMFEQNGWTVPTTYAELETLCATINSANIKSSTGATVRPFAWSGSDREYYWDYPVLEWWAQLAGIEKVDTVLQYLGPTGKYADGYEMYNPNTYYKEFIEAYSMWHSLIAENATNSIKNAYSTGLNTAKSAFVSGEAAMIPYAQWAKFELEQVADNEELDFNIAMMETPKAKADSKNFNYMVGFGDSIIIPENATQKDKAKDFLKYLATYDACKNFVKDSHGSFLAFDYKDVDMSDVESKDTYIKSIHDKLNNSTNFSVLSKNPISYRTVNAVMPWPNNNYYYKNACAEPSKYTAQIVGEKVYTTAKTNWKTWLRTANLSD